MTVKVGDWVKVIKESKTIGLVGSRFKVVNVEDDFVEVVVTGNNRIRFNMNEIKPMTFKERWGIDKLPTLYHGTDYRFVKLSDDQRKVYTETCNMFIDCLSEFYLPYINNRDPDPNKTGFLNEEIEKNNPKLTHNIIDAMNNLMMMKFSEEWEYGDFYLTSNKTSACVYAHNAFAGGELGFTAYHLIKGVELIGVDFSKNKDIKNRVNLIKILAEGKAQPAIYAFDDLLPEYLQPAFGGCLSNYIQNGRIGIQEFRYKKSVNLSERKPEMLDLDLKTALQKIHKERNN